MNCVTGLIYGLNKEQTLPFVESLVQNYDGDVVIFLAKQNPNDTNFLKEYGIKGVECDLSCATESERNIRIPQIFKEYFKGSNYQNILISDIRDVVFQAPIQFNDDNKLHFWKENTTIEGSCFNANWIKFIDNYWSKNIYPKIRNKPVVCYGVVMSSLEVYLEHLDQMIREMKPGFINQGVMNYLMRTGQTKDIVIHCNGDQVSHMGYVKREDVVFNEEGFMINKKGEVVSVLHQYDRIFGVYKDNNVWKLRR